MSQEKTAIKTTYFSIAGNALLAIIKWLTGYFGNSYAMIADAIESTTDIFASVLVLMGIKYASKPADENHPYGHGRAETLVTFIVVGFLMVSATVIAFESVRHIRLPHEAPESYTLWVLAAIILWKELSYQWVIRKSRETNSSSLKADAWHHRSDAVTSVAAFIGISIALIGGEGYEAADDWAALFASAFIIYNAWLIFRPALGEIMDEHQYDDLIARIRDVAATVEGVKGTEKCFIRKAGMKYLVDLHATVEAEIPVRQGHEIAHRLTAVLKKEIPLIGYVLIHIEPEEV